MRSGRLSSRNQRRACFVTGDTRLSFIVIACLSLAVRTYGQVTTLPEAIYAAETANRMIQVAALEHEKEKLAVLIDQLSAAVDVHVKSAGMVNSTLIDTLQSLSEFYPDHIWKENYLLLPMADKLFSEADQQALAQALHTIDSNRGEDARRTVEEFNAAIRLCSETALLWDRAAIA